MRRIINSTYISVDGVVEKPHHWPSTGSDGGAGEAAQIELLQSCDALLMGRRTYESFAAVWPTRSGDPYSEQINTMDKYVVTTTLTDPEWNNTAVIDDPVTAVEALKAKPGKNIVQYGFGPLTHTLLDHGLLDEVRLWVHPLLVRGGGPQDLLYRDGALTQLALEDVRALESGVVILTYQVR